MQQITEKNINYFVEQLEKKHLEIHSIVIRQNNQTLLSKGYYPFDPDQTTSIYSCSKSFISIAIGILYDQGKIDLDENLLTYLPKYQYLKDYEASQITIRQLLTMQLSHNIEPYLPKDGDWVEAILKKPLSYPIGTRFNYYNLSTYLLSTVVAEISQTSTFNFLKQHVFKPLGISNCYFEEDNKKRNTGGWGLHISTNDLAKFGQLILNKGVYNNQRIVSEKWINMATSKQISTEELFASNKTESREGYGFQFWMSTHNSFRASGLYGQICFIQPENNLVLAITSAAGSSQPILDILFDCLDNNKESDYHSKFQLNIPISKEENTDIINSLNNKKLLFLENQSYFNDLTLSFNDDLLTVDLTRKNKTYKIVARKNKWEKFTSDIYYMSPLSWLAAGTDKTEGYHISDSYAAYYWLDKCTLQLIMRNADQPARYCFTIYFDDNYLLLKYNVTELYTDFSSGEGYCKYR